MDVDTYNWFYGAVEYAFICNEELQQCGDFIETTLLPALEQEEQARYEAEALAARRLNILKWTLPSAVVTGLLLGIVGGGIIGN